MTNVSDRSAKEVLEDHLRKSQDGAVEANLQQNYAEDVVVLIRDGVHRGHAGARQLADRLRRELPDWTFEYRTVLVEGEIGFLEWSGRGGDSQVDDGVDSFVIRQGRILAQTIHCTVRPSGP